MTHNDDRAQTPKPGQRLGQAREVLGHDDKIGNLDLCGHEQLDNRPALGRSRRGRIHLGQQGFLPQLPGAPEHQLQRHGSSPGCVHALVIIMRCGRIADVRFMTLADVAETLNISSAQAYALVRSGELRAIKVGGRGQWRVETTELEAYIQRAYQQTAELLDSPEHSSDLG